MKAYVNGSADISRMGRRELLRLGGLGLGWLGIGQPILARRSDAEAAPDRSIILLLLLGGPSQLETWDPKPDARSEVRGPFGSIATSCPGIRISEHLPRLAVRMDRLAIVRSVHHDEAPIHETGCQLIQTGRLCRADQEAPHFGSVVAHSSGNRRGQPASIVIPGPIQNTGIDIPHGQGAGWLGTDCVPFALDADPAGPGFDASSARVQSVRTTGESAPSDVGGNPFNMSAETESLRDEYGRTSFGQSCLLARRLVEAGTRVVTVNMFQSVFNQVTWDCHGAAPFSTLDDYAQVLLPDLDRAFAALIDDLERRGRLDRTLVVAAGEFGRTPRINASGGRDHWPGVWSVALAGGGIRAGQVIGASDRDGAYPADSPVTPQDILASMYQSLGIDSSRYLPRQGADPYALVENGRPIRELFV
jgi:uncharacterized protein (DUF1501 family)